MIAAARWLIGGVLLVLLCLWLWLLLADPIRDRLAEHRRPEMCEINTNICVHAAPPPVELRPGESALRPDHRDYPLILAASGAIRAARIYPYDRIVETAPGASEQQGRIGEEDETSRLYLVRLRSGGEALVVVRDTRAGRGALLLRRGAHLAEQRVRVDPDRDLSRFALLDPQTAMGDTFQLRQASGRKAFSYLVFAPNSPEMHEHWLSSKGSNCGYGPLTAVPPEWERAYQEACSR